MTWRGTEQLHIQAPVERVWGLIADLPSHERLAGSGEIRSISASGPLAAGTTWDSDEVVAGRAFVARSECVEFDPPKVLSWHSYPPPMREGDPDTQFHAAWWFRLTPAGDGTGVEHTFEVVEPAKRAWMLRLFYLMTRRRQKILAGMRGTLENLRREAEGSSCSTS